MCWDQPKAGEIGTIFHHLNTSTGYQRRGESGPFFIMKVWYIILPKILNIQWIIKIQKVLKTRDLALSETTVSGTFPSLESFWKVLSRKKSWNLRVPYTPSSHRNRPGNTSKSAWSKVTKVDSVSYRHELVLCQFWCDLKPTRRMRHLHTKENVVPPLRFPSCVPLYVPAYLGNHRLTTVSRIPVLNTFLSCDAHNVKYLFFKRAQKVGPKLILDQMNLQGPVQLWPFCV